MDQKNLINKAVGMRMEAKSLEDRAKVMKEEANGVLKDVMGAMDVDQIKHSLGTVSLVAGTSVSTNRDTLKMEMVRAGLSVDKVNEIMDKATKVTQYKTIQFKPA